MRRRELLTRATVLTAGAWAAPAIRTLPAHAQAGSSAGTCAGYSYNLSYTLNAPGLSTSVDPANATRPETASDGDQRLSSLVFPADHPSPYLTLEAPAVANDFSTDCTSRSSAPRVTLDLHQFGGPVIVLEGVESVASTDCGLPVTVGSSLAGVTVDGAPVGGLSTAPNTVIPVGPWGQITINEQAPDLPPGHVNAIHVELARGAVSFDLILGHSEVSVDGCP